MAGILGGLPPGLQGWVLADQMNQQKQAGKMQELQGILGMQGALMQQQAAMEQQAINRQLKPLQIQQLQMAVDQARQNAALRQKLMGGMGPQAPAFGEGGVSLPGGGQGNVMTGQVAPAPQGGMGGINPQIAGLLLSGDSGLGKLGSAMLDQTKPTDKMREAVALGFQPGTPQFNAYVSTQFTQGGAWQPDGKGGFKLATGYAQGAGDVKRAEAGAGAEFDLVDVPMPGGVQKMTRADAAKLLSGRMQVSPEAQRQRDAEAAHIRTAEGRSGAGLVPTQNVVPGFQPKQPDRSPGQTAVDQAFAKEYVEFKASGGYADTAKQLEQLRAAASTLGSDDSLTGPMRGALPDSVRAFTNPTAVATKEAIQEVAQRNLRLVLGAQFTAKEGEQLIARVYNDRLSTGENKQRVDRLIQQIDAAARAKQDAANYFEKNGTLSGWNGKLYTIDDFRKMDFNGPKTKPVIPARRKEDILKAADAILNGGR